MATQIAEPASSRLYTVPAPAPVAPPPVAPQPTPQPAAPVPLPVSSAPLMPAPPPKPSYTLPPAAPVIPAMPSRPPGLDPTALGDRAPFITGLAPQALHSSVRDWSAYHQGQQKLVTLGDRMQRADQKQALHEAKQQDEVAKQAGYNEIVARGGIPDLDASTGRYVPRTDLATGEPLKAPFSTGKQPDAAGKGTVEVKRGDSGAMEVIRKGQPKVQPSTDNRIHFGDEVIEPEAGLRHPDARVREKSSGMLRSTRLRELAQQREDLRFQMGDPKYLGLTPSEIEKIRTSTNAEDVEKLRLFNERAGLREEERKLRKERDRINGLSHDDWTREILGNTVTTAPDTVDKQNELLQGEQNARIQELTAQAEARGQRQAVWQEENARGVPSGNYEQHAREHAGIQASKEALDARIAELTDQQKHADEWRAARQQERQEIQAKLETVVEGARKGVAGLANFFEGSGPAPATPAVPPRANGDVEFKSGWAASADKILSGLKSPSDASKTAKALADLGAPKLTLSELNRPEYRGKNVYLANPDTVEVSGASTRTAIGKYVAPLGIGNTYETKVGKITGPAVAGEPTQKVSLDLARRELGKHMDALDARIAEAYGGQDMQGENRGFFTGLKGQELQGIHNDLALMRQAAFDGVVPINRVIHAYRAAGVEVRDVPDVNEYLTFGGTKEAAMRGEPGTYRADRDMQNTISQEDRADRLKAYVQAYRDQPLFNERVVDTAANDVHARIKGEANRMKPFHERLGIQWDNAADNWRSTWNTFRVAGNILLLADESGAADALKRVQELSAQIAKRGEVGGSDRDSWFGQKGLNTVVSMVPDMAETVLTTLGGAVIGTLLGPEGTATGAASGLFAKAAMKKMLIEETEKWVGKGMSKDAARSKAAGLITRGLSAEAKSGKPGVFGQAMKQEVSQRLARYGVFASSFRGNAGEYLQTSLGQMTPEDLQNDPGRVDRAIMASLALGVPAAMLDVLDGVETGAAKRLLGQTAGETRGLYKNAAKSWTKHLGGGVAKEFSTGFGQGVIQVAVQRLVDQKSLLDPLTDEEKQSIIDNAIGEAIGGGAYHLGGDIGGKLLRLRRLGAFAAAWKAADRVDAAAQRVANFATNQDFKGFAGPQTSEVDAMVDQMGDHREAAMAAGKYEEAQKFAALQMGLLRFKRGAVQEHGDLVAAATQEVEAAPADVQPVLQGVQQVLQGVTPDLMSEEELTALGLKRGSSGNISRTEGSPVDVLPDGRWILTDAGRKVVEQHAPTLAGFQGVDERTARTEAQGKEPPVSIPKNPQKGFIEDKNNGVETHTFGSKTEAQAFLAAREAEGPLATSGITSVKAKKGQPALHTVTFRRAPTPQTNAPANTPGHPSSPAPVGTSTEAPAVQPAPAPKRDQTAAPTDQSGGKTGKPAGPSKKTSLSPVPEGHERHFFETRAEAKVFWEARKAEGVKDGGIAETDLGFIVQYPKLAKSISSPSDEGAKSDTAGDSPRGTTSPDRVPGSGRASAVVPKTAADVVADARKQLPALNPQQQGQLDSFAKAGARFIPAFAPFFSGVRWVTDPLNSAGMQYDRGTGGLVLSLPDLASHAELTKNRPGWALSVLAEEAIHAVTHRLITEGKINPVELMAAIRTEMPETYKVVKDSYKRAGTDDEVLAYEFLRMVLQKRIVFDVDGVKVKRKLTEEFYEKTGDGFSEIMLAHLRIALQAIVKAIRNLFTGQSGPIAAEALRQADAIEKELLAALKPGKKISGTTPGPEAAGPAVDAKKKGSKADAVTSLPSDAGAAGATPAASNTVDEQAHEAATSPKNELSEPTAPMIEAGNYKKGHIKVGGLRISIENPAGSVREGKGADGKPWSVTMHSHYGYILGTQEHGEDDEHIDVFVQQGTPEDYNGPVFVIRQMKEDNNTFDEHKVVLGLGITDDGKAREEYRKNYSPGWNRDGGYRKFVSVDSYVAFLDKQDASTKKAGASEEAPAGLTSATPEHIPQEGAPGALTENAPKPENVKTEKPAGEEPVMDETKVAAAESNPGEVIPSRPVEPTATPAVETPTEPPALTLSDFTRGEPVRFASGDRKGQAGTVDRIAKGSGKVNVKLADGKFVAVNPVELEKGTGEVAKPAPPQEAAPVPKASAAQPAKKTKKEIEDFGEKIGGARKDRWRERGLSIDDYEGLSETERQAYAVKPQVFPKPDYAAWIAAGMPRGIAWLVKQAVDSIAPVPNITRQQQADPAQRDAALRRYVETVGVLRDELPKVRTTDDLNELNHRLFGLHPVRDKATLGLVSTGKRQYELAAALGIASYKVERETRKMNPVWPEPQEQWQRMFPINKVPAGMKVWTKGEGHRITETETWQITKKDGNWNRIVADGFTSLEAAQEWAKKKAAETRGPGGKQLSRPLVGDAKRVGPDYRNGKDVTGDELLKTFGFRGGEFGNWTNEADRQQSLNQAFDGLHDLARILNVPPAALSLNGELGIAFGSRGGGKGSAHYEPARVVINLTRTRGAGSLAHEWAHAVDDYFGRAATGGRIGQYVSHGAKGTGTFRMEMAVAVNDVMAAIRERQFTQEEYASDLKENREAAAKRLKNWMDAVDRATGKLNLTDEEKEEVATLREQVNALATPPMKENGRPDMVTVATDLLGIYATAARREKARIEWPSRDKNLQDTALAIAAASGTLHFTNSELAKAEAGTIEVPARKVKTNLLKASEEMGDYWERRHELFARTFESFIEDKIREEGNASPYLVAHTSSGGDWGSVYPNGDERTATNAALQKLVDTMQTRETEKGVAISSQSLRFSEHNRLTNLNPSGVVMEKIRVANPDFDPAAPETAVYSAGELRTNAVVALNRKVAETRMGAVTEHRVPTADLLMTHDATEFLYAPKEVGSQSVFNWGDEESGRRINEDLDRLEEAVRAEEETHEPSKVGDPRLSRSMDNPVIRAIDEQRKGTLVPETFAEWDEQAQAKLDALGGLEPGIDYVIQKVAENQPLDKVDTRLALILEQQLMTQRFTGPALERYRRFLRAFRQDGTETARSMAARRDANLTPKQRYQKFLLEHAVEPSQGDRDAAAKKRRDAEKVEAPEDAARLRREADTLEDESSKRMLKKLTDDLRRSGFTLDEWLNTDVRIERRAPIFERLTANLGSWREKAVRRMQGGDIPFRRIARQLGKTEDQVRAVRTEFEKQFTSWALDQLKPGMTADDLLKLAPGARATAVSSQSPLSSQGMTDEDKNKIINEAMMKMGLVPVEKQGKARVKATRGTKTVMTPEQAARMTIERWKNRQPKAISAVGNAVKTYHKAKDLRDAARNDLMARLISIGVEKDTAAEMATLAHERLQDEVLGGRTENITYLDLDDARDVVVKAKAIGVSRADGIDKLRELWFNSMLSGVKTQIANIASYPAHIAGHMGLTRTIEAGLNSLGSLVGLGNAKATYLGDIGAMWKATVRGISEAMGLSAAAWRTGVDFLAFDKMIDPVAGRVDGDVLKQIKAMGLEVPHEAIKGRTGAVIRVPSRLMQTMDVFGKTLVAHMEVAGHALRLARRDIKREGKTFANQAERQADLEKRIEHYIETPGSEAWKFAVNEAVEAGFQTPLQGGRPATNSFDRMERMLAGIVGKIDSALTKRAGQSSGGKIADLLKLIIKMKFLAFVKTPWNLYRIGLRKSPLGTIPFVWRTAEGLLQLTNDKPFFSVYGKFYEHLAEQMLAWGATALLLGMAEGDPDDDKKPYLLAGGPLMGGGDRAENLLRQAVTGGNYLLRIGDRETGVPVPFGRIEPVATVLGTTIDMLRAYKMDNNATNADRLGRFVQTLVGQAQNKTFLHGLSDAVNMMEYVIRWNTDKMKQVALDIPASIVPNIIKDPIRSVDAYVRDRTDNELYRFVPIPDLAEPLVRPGIPEEVKKGGNALTRLFVDTGTDTSKPLPPWLQAVNVYNSGRPGKPFEKGGTWAPGDPSRRVSLGKGPDGKTVEVELGPKAYRWLKVQTAAEAERRLSGRVSPAEASQPTEDTMKRIIDLYDDAKGAIRDRLKRRPVEELKL